MNDIWWKYSQLGIRASVLVGNHYIEKDDRLLIPFITRQRKWGLMNRKGEIVVKPIYDAICNDCWEKDDLLIVGILHPYAFIKKDGSVDARVKYHYGLIHTDGTMFLDVKYNSVTLGSVITVIGDDGCFAMDRNGNVVIPQGRYSWIDGFDDGLARVNKQVDGKEYWGIVDCDGKEVLPLDYDKIWNFYGKHLDGTNVVKDGQQYFLKFDYIRPSKYQKDYELTEKQIRQIEKGAWDEAKDMWLDAFEGDPDNYWNID